MAFGDPANAGANHGNADNLATATTFTTAVAFATTAGNTLVVAVRAGGSASTIAVDVSENNGSTFSAATAYGSAHTVASAGLLELFYFRVAGAAAGQVQIRVTVGVAATIRLVWGEYVGQFAANGTEVFTDNGATLSYNSGAMTTSVVSTMIGQTIWGRAGTGVESALTGGTTNSLTWTIRDFSFTTSWYAVALADFNAGGQAAGTYNNLGSYTQTAPDFVGAAIYSFIAAAGAVNKFTPGRMPLGA